MRHHSFRSEEYAGVQQEAGSAIGKIQNEDELFFKLRKHFDYNVCPFYVPDRNTALALAHSSMTGPGDLYLCSSTSYVASRGHAAIKNIAGIEPLEVQSEFGKITPAAISGSLESAGAEDRERCRVVSISQPTEYGMIYSPKEISEICRCAHENGMQVIMDGSRIFFAAAKILKAFREQTMDAGVDATTFGGEKNGAPEGEAVLIFKKDAAEKFRENCKKNNTDTSGASAFSSGINRLLTERLWRYNAIHANEMAKKLAEGISGIPGIKLFCKVETNKVLAEVSPEIFQKLKDNYSLKSFRCPDQTVRFVTNYKTSESEIEELTGILRSTEQAEQDDNIHSS
ncbi:threonine aldolase family protein [Methanolacinia paynteri]|uniref:threonine aldolase family protein n=1 Tax=Methanolacinia paynteri TaxID=230356 RepID=UPI00064E2A19|nr:aminotransferase class V-fold PLP-dependent enzyme [Methanolacinia paynteri]